MKNEIKEIEEELAKISFANIGHCVNTNLILDTITNLHKEIERLNNIINELEKDIEEYFKKEYPDRKIENYNLKNCTYDYALVILGKLKELKEKSDKE